MPLSFTPLRGWTVKKLGYFGLLGVFLMLTATVQARAEGGKPKTTKKTEKGKYIIEKRSDGTTIKYEKKTKYEFEGADIEGLFKRPSGSYISNVQGVQTRSIIRIRKNFDPEVEDSARLLR